MVPAVQPVNKQKQTVKNQLEILNQFHSDSNQVQICPAALISGFSAQVWAHQIAIFLKKEGFDEYPAQLLPAATCFSRRGTEQFHTVYMEHWGIA